MIIGNAHMQFVFIYVQNDKYKCLSTHDEALSKKLLEEGWKHIATVNPEIWIEHFLNSSEEDRVEAIKDISIKTNPCVMGI